MKIEITRGDGMFIAIIDDGVTEYEINTVETGFLPTEVEAKIFTQILSEYLVHILLQPPTNNVD